VSEFAEMNEAFRKVGESMGSLGLSAAVAAAAVETSSRHYAVASRSVIKKFKCAKCGKYKLGQEKVIGPRRKGGPGVLPWCLPCVAVQVQSWEFLGRP
jgi:hypothetical protein